MNSTSRLYQLLTLLKYDHTINNLFNEIKNTPQNNNSLLTLYKHAIPLIEKRLWEDNLIIQNIENYQHVFHELEELIEHQKKIDQRHHFIIAIPVADRPKHLQACLKSILTLCQAYNYGGYHNGTYTKIKIIIADDSKHEKNINKNKELTDIFTKNGLSVNYFGQAEQKKILTHLDKNKIKNIIGQFDDQHFFHKGASITRNITYLKLLQLNNPKTPTLFYFIDSDQEFQVNFTQSSINHEAYAINYFYYLDKIFTEKNISILTGKVVGDPPVSPSVMAGTFINDITHFIKKMATLQADAVCNFHDHNKMPNEDAAYHDMAKLFGFKNQQNSFDYQCSLKNKHQNSSCFNDFNRKLNQFFYGVHCTRKSTYMHEDIMSSVKPARTIYSGNYIFKPENLKYFIPFAPLKLRMAGPVLGRIIQSELDNNFASANLPMLHKRTVNDNMTSEYRSGVDKKNQLIDLSDEFIRQFFGDVMLFSIISLTKQGYPKKQISQQVINKTIDETFVKLKKNYDVLQSDIFYNIKSLKTLLHSPEHWWNQQSLSVDISELEYFIKNIEFNFSKNAKIYHIINSKEDLEFYKQNIAHAIIDYHTDMNEWQTVLAGYQH